MATYYKRAERNADNRINWAEVGADMTAMVREEDRVRQEKKAAINQDARDFAAYAENPPMGLHQGFNEFTSEYAANAQEYALMVKNLVASGQMNLREYTNIRANLKQGTEEAFSVSEEYNTQFKAAQERGEIDPETGYPTSQEYEQWVLGTVQGFGNYSDHRLYISPVDGKVSLGTLVENEDGNKELSKDTGSFISVNALRNRARSQYDFYNVDNATAGMVNQLGQVINVIMEDGVKTREDASEDKDFIDALDMFVDAQLDIPTNVSSVLTNTLGTNPDTGNPYSFTDNPQEAAANPDLILSIVNPLQPSSGIPVPAFNVDLREILKDAGLTAEEMAAVIANNEGQVKAAGEALKVGVMSKLDKIETPRAEFNNQNDNRENAAEKKSAATSVKRIADIHNGTKSEFDAALPFVQGLDPSVNRIYINPDNTNEVLIDRVDSQGNIITLEPFLKGDSAVDFVTSIYTTLGLDENLLDQALLDSKIADRTNPASTHVGAAGDSRQPSPVVIPNFDDPLPSDESDYPRLVSDVHSDAFGTEKNAKAYSNAEQEFFSTIGISNAQIKTLDEDTIDEYIVGAGRLSNDNSATQLFIPGVMTMPILIPDSNTKVEFEAINRVILNAIRNGTLLTPKDFKDIIEEFSEYNNEKMAKNIIGIEWNNGNGPPPLTDAQGDAATNAGTGDKSGSDSTQRRSIADIMAEDRVSLAEAVKIFNAQ